MRILHVTPYSADAWAYGGIPRVVGSLTRGLARRGHDVTICTTDASDASSRLAPVGTPKPRGIELRVFPNLSNVLAYHLQLFLPAGMGQYLRKQAGNFDIAHLHACRNVPGVLAARHLRRAGVPYVLSPHGTAPLIERRLAAKRLFDVAGGSRVISGAARVAAVSQAEEHQLRALGVPPDAIRLVPNPIDLDEFKPLPPRGAFRRRFSIGDAPLVLFLGKLTPRKRVDVLARAFAALQRPEARLVIAGNDMGHGGAIHALVDTLGISGRTTFTGLLRGAERLEALADADVVVYPSEHEIFGLVAIESLLCGTPVVVSGDSGCGEIIGRTGGGIVVPVGDVSALGSAIEQVLADQDTWRFAAINAKWHVAAAFGSDTVCERLESVYAELTATPT